MTALATAHAGRFETSHYMTGSDSRIPTGTTALSPCVIVTSDISVPTALLVSRMLVCMWLGSSKCYLFDYRNVRKRRRSLDS
jgi:hypothetical protein